MYKCLKCKKEIKFEGMKERIRCPFCGYRILYKERPKTPTKVKAW